MDNRPGGPMALDAEQLVTVMQRVIALFLYPSGIFLSLFATASLVPHMLEKGTIDLLLSKPISRPALLGARFLGGVVIAGANLVYFVGGVGTILGFKTGVWNWGFYLSGLLMTVYFAALLAFMVLFGIVFRSTTISMMIAALMFIVAGVVRLAHTYADWPVLITSPVARFLTKSIVETLYYVLPRSYGIGQMSTSLILHRPIDSWAPAFATVGSGALALGLAMLLFRRIDF
jgi:ABC-type transport system involved in multi-copper enzyme maturation permease subunit